jgi:hypothetical protein
MNDDFSAAFSALKTALSRVSDQLVVRTDSALEYKLVTKTPSPFPQHKGHPMDFGSVRMGKAYVSLHLMPIYMSPELNKTLTPALKKRMQGKSCFNFKTAPEPELAAELTKLIEASLQAWRKRKWL